MINNIDNKLNICGIYKINYDNGKIYIGQARSIYTRALEHNSKNKYPCDKALKKHDATIEILQRILDVNLLDRAESFYINLYDATNKEIGYNILKEGNASGKAGIDNCNAKLTESQLNDIIDLLINHPELSCKDIANKYNISDSVIYRISKGYSYHNNNLFYPLRNNNHDYLIKNSIEDYFNSEKELLQLKNDLLFRWDLTIENDLLNKYHIPLKIIRAINQGEKFAEIGNFNYPIRQKNTRNNLNLSPQIVEEILYELKTTKKSMDTIGKEYKIGRATISKINQGLSYPIKDYKYPARD